jgi:hypothetical protein
MCFSGGWQDFSMRAAAALPLEVRQSARRGRLV